MTQTQEASPGRIVHYAMSAHDAEQVNRRRADGQAAEAGNTGKIIHVGNEAREGDVYPAIVVRAWGSPAGSVNLQVFLDGNDTLWVTSRSWALSSSPGNWSWPPRV